MAKRLPGIQGKSIRWLSILVATSLAAVGITSFVAPEAAWALGPGKVCMYLAPSGADNLGHVGWEVQEPGRGYWAGSTEAAGETWIVDETSETAIHNDFKYAGYYHSANYYTMYRCHSTPTSAVGAAIAKARAEANSYNVVFDNCLTKSIDIFNAYYSPTNLPWGVRWPPVEYFDVALSYPWVNWGPIHYL